MQENESGLQRGMLFIDNCDYLAAPVVPDGDDVSTVTPDFGFCWLDMNMVELVDRDSVFLFSDCHQLEDGFFYYTTMTSKRYMDDNFIPEKHHAEWNQKKRKKVVAESCGCQVFL